MAPKLSPQQIDNKFLEMRFYLRARLADFTARGAAFFKTILKPSKKIKPLTTKQCDCRVIVRHNNYHKIKNYNCNALLTITDGIHLCN